jgi:hypothetical protein
MGGQKPVLCRGGSALFFHFPTRGHGYWGIRHARGHRHGAFLSFSLGTSKAPIALNLPLRPDLPHILPHAHEMSLLIRHFVAVFAPHLYSHRTPPSRP